MVNKNNKNKKSIELFDEKSGELIRIMRFKTPKEFEYFLYSYQLMRYPGYNWRYHTKIKKKKQII